MSKNKPEDPAKIQMTPVEFSPAASEDAIGSVGGIMPLRQFQYPVSVPIAIILLTLIFSTVRDISSFNRAIDDIEKANAPSVEMLKKAPRQTEFIDAMRTGLQKLAPTDPTAAQLMREYFPEEKKATQASGTPSK